MDEFSTTITSIGTSFSSKTTSTQNVYYGSFAIDDDDSYKKIFKLLIVTSIPKILSSFLSILIVTINIIWIGHNSSKIGEFAGVLLGITMINISLNVAIISFTSGLDKFFNFSYRSQLYKMVGTFIQRYIFIIHFIIIIFSFMIYYSKYILIYFFHQKHSNVSFAYDYLLIFIIAAWPISMFSVLRKYIQSFSSDNHNIFIFISLLIAISFEIISIYLLTEKAHTINNVERAAISIVITYYIALISLYLISKCHPNIVENITLTYPSTCCGHWIFNITELNIYFTHCLKKSIYVTFELCMLEIYVFFAARFSTEFMCAYVISLNILRLFQRITYGISATSSIMIKHQLFTANGSAARRIWNVSILLNIISVSILTAIMLTFSHSFAAMYTSHESIVEKVKKSIPFTCLFFFFDSLLRSFICGMHGIGRESMTWHIYLICFYCFGFPLGIIYGFKGFLSINDPRFRNINGLWLGASFGIFISLCILILIRIRIDWQAEISRSQVLFQKMDIQIQQFRNRMLSKYGKYSNYGINSGLIDDDFRNNSPSSSARDARYSSGHYNWSTSENIIREDDSQMNSYYDNTNYKNDTPKTDNSDNVDEYIGDGTDDGKYVNIQGMQSIPINYINDFRIAPYSTASSMARSMPQSVGPPSRDVNAKHGPIVI